MVDLQRLCQVQIICCKCQVNSDCYGRGEKTLYNRAFRARKSSGKIVLFPHKQRPIAYMATAPATRPGAVAHVQLTNLHHYVDAFWDSFYRCIFS